MRFYDLSELCGSFTAWRRVAEQQGLQQKLAPRSALDSSQSSGPPQPEQNSQTAVSQLLGVETPGHRSGAS